MQIFDDRVLHDGVDALRLCDQMPDLLRRAHLLIELGEQVVALADVSPGGDGELENLDGKRILQIVVQQFRELLQQSYQICVMKIVIA